MVWYKLRLMGQTWTHGIDMDTWFRHGLMVLTWTHGIGKDSCTQTYGIDNTHGIDLKGGCNNFEYFNHKFTCHWDWWESFEE